MSTPQPRESGQMTINLPGVIKTLGESLYSDPSVSIRELIQNANDVCILRQVDDPTAPPSEVHIHFDPWKRILVVEDNGAGMTEDEVKEFLTVIGSSKTDEVRIRLEEIGQRNLADRLIGRFGLGLLSAFIISDRIEFVTLSYKTGANAIWWACDGGQEYQMGPDVSRTTPGTTVTVYVNPKHIGMLKDDKLIELIHLYADLLEVPIYLDPIRRPVNAMTDPWHREATEAEYRQFVADRYPNDAILDIIPIEIEEDDGKFKVGGVLFVPKQPMFIIKEHGDVIVYVRRMFVCKDERTILPDWAKFVKGVIESPNLRETTSREAILHDQNFLRVQKAIGKIILDYLTRLSNENPRLFKEIVTNHNLVIKAWAIASNELFERIKDIVLFTSDVGLINLPRYFETSRHSKGIANQSDSKRYIFYFTTPSGAGQQSVLFSAKGLRVIDAQHFPDESFLQKYANMHEDVILKRLDVGGDFIFEELDYQDGKWVELEEAYGQLRIDAKVVKFMPQDIPAVLIFPETEPITNKVEELLADPTLSPTLKNLVRRMWDEHEDQHKGRISVEGILYVNAINPVVQKLVGLDLSDLEIQEVMAVIYNNALMLSTQGARMYLTPDNARRIFESNNRAIAALMTRIYEVRDLKALQNIGRAALLGAGEVKMLPSHSIEATEHTRHITCFIAMPFKNEYDILVEALRDVLEVAPYFWQVGRADSKYFGNTIQNNVGQWIARAQCFVVDLSERNESIMMELGHIYWSYPERPLLLLQREGSQSRMVDLNGALHISYPWGDVPDRSRIAASLRKEINKFDSFQSLKGQAHFLSIRIMPGWLPTEQSKLIANHYETVEELVRKEASTVLQELGTNAIRVSTIEDIQHYLLDLCGLK